jgi:two-component system phosphate regulon response regulator PhoB
MAALKVLVIEDEEDILQLIAYNLKREGYSVIEADTGEKGLEKALREKPAAILLDLMLPGIDGFEVLRRAKASPELLDIPVIIVSAKGSEADVVKGLEIGADDYIPKPFRTRELVARVRTVLRGKGSSAERRGGETVSVRGIDIDLSRREVRVDGRPVDLRFTEFEILHLLARRCGLVFTRGQIVDIVRGHDYAVTERSVDVHIAGLRKKLGEVGSLIQTVRSVGYRLKGPDL